MNQLYVAIVWHHYDYVSILSVSYHYHYRYQMSYQLSVKVRLLRDEILHLS